jgi:hypothetical protein
MEDVLSEPSDDVVAEEPWPTPRGPHLPDALGGLFALPGPAWIFVVLAVARLGWGFRDAHFGPGIDPWQVGQLVIAEIPAVVSILLVAALLTRHPDAWSCGRSLFLGVALLAVVEGLRVVQSPLEPFFEGLTPGDAAASFVVPSALAFQIGVTLLGAAAIAGIALGLIEARRREDRSASWPVSAVLAAMVVLIGIAGIVSVSHLPFDQLPTGPTVSFMLISTVVLNVVSAAAFGYLASTLTAGARAGEGPPLAWRVAGAGSWLVLGSLAVLAAVGLVETTPESETLVNNAAQLAEGVFALGYLGLLGGFALGLPSLHPLADDGAEAG